MGDEVTTIDVAIIPTVSGRYNIFIVEDEHFVLQGCLNRDQLAALHLALTTVIASADD